MSTTLWQAKQALLPGWMPDRLFYEGRLRPPYEVGRTLRARTEELSGGPRPARSIVGPRGSGTSTLARALATEVTREDACAHPGAHARIIRIEARGAASVHDVLVRTFRNFDPTFPGQGYSAVRLASLLRRRLEADASIAILWFDNLAEESEGDPQWDLLTEALQNTGSSSQSRRTRVLFSGEFAFGPESIPPPERVPTRLYRPAPNSSEMLQALSAMAGSAFREAVPNELLARVRDQLISEGWGLSVGARALRTAGERAERRGSSKVEWEDLPAKLSGPRLRDGPLLDDLILGGLRANRGLADPASLWEFLRTRLRAAGKNLPSRSQVRRHVQELERLGLVQRHVRLGGQGGTWSRYRILEPQGPQLIDGIVSAAVAGARVGGEAAPGPVPPAPALASPELFPPRTPMPS